MLGSSYCSGKKGPEFAQVLGVVVAHLWDSPMKAGPKTAIVQREIVATYCGPVGGQARPRKGNNQPGPPTRFFAVGGRDAHPAQPRELSGGRRDVQHSESAVDDRVASGSRPQPCAALTSRPAAGTHEVTISTSAPIRATMTKLDQSPYAGAKRLDYGRGDVDGAVHARQFVHGAVAEKHRRITGQLGELQCTVRGFELPGGVDDRQVGAPLCPGLETPAEAFWTAKTSAAVNVSEHGSVATELPPVRSVVMPVGCIGTSRWRRPSQSAGRGHPLAASRVPA